jgi:PAS domain S-box-containing protein
VRYRRLFESAKDGVLLIDPKTRRIVDANPFMTQLLGYAHDELSGKELFEIGLLKDADASRDAFHELQESGSIRYEDLELKTKSGERREVEVVANLYQEDGDRIIQCNIRDISERKLAEAAVRRAAEFNEAVMGGMGEGLYTVDQHGLVTSMNPAAEKLFGWTLDELRGRRMHDATHYQHPDGSAFPVEDCAGYQVLQNGMPLTDHEDVFIHKDGTFFDVTFSSAPIREDGRISGLVVVFQEITERKRAEEAIRKSEADFRSHAEDLARFNRIAVGRELRMIELKKEINELCERQGQPPRYSLDFEQEPNTNP